MASSPAVGGSSRSMGYISSPSSSGKRQFAERNPRTLVGLQKVNVQLQKELEKLERQQATAVNNIANHQQAMKMTWRRLEQKRATESPVVSGATSSRKEEGGARKSLFYSKTKLYVSKTPDIYNPTSERDTVADADTARLTTIHPSPGVLEYQPSSRHSTRENRLVTSPYISSPFNYRRTQTAPAPDATSKLEDTSSHQFRKKRELKLSPIASESQPLLVTSSTTNKKTLLQASTVLTEEAKSNKQKGAQGSASFSDFFATDRERPASQTSLLVSPMQKGTRFFDVEDQESASHNTTKSENDVTHTSSEPSLAEMLEQIKHCRYIRRYHPDGTALEEYY